MSRTDTSDSSNDQITIVDDPRIAADQHAADSLQRDERKRLSATAAWTLSFGAHAAAILTAGVVVYATPVLLTDVPPTRVVAIPAPEERPQPKERAVLRVDVSAATISDVLAEVPSPSIDASSIVAVDVLSDLDVEISSATQVGRDEAVSFSEAGGAGAFMAIGAGGGGAGMFGNRSGGDRKRAVARGGGGRATESSVDAALRWFKRHQSPNGSWDPVGYPANCQLPVKCEPGSIDGIAPQDAAIAMTSYALLCFMGSGYDHLSPNRYRTTVRKGVEWLISVQQNDGSFGAGNYAHAIGSLALTEAFAFTDDRALRRPAQRAVDVMVQRQNDFGGWDYVGPSSRNDSSVTGWKIMALKNAQVGGLAIGQAKAKSRAWLQQTWQTTNPRWQQLSPYDQARFPYVVRSDTRQVDIAASPTAVNHSLESVGLVAGVFLGRTAGDLLIETLANTVMQHQLPQRWPTSTYYLYYNTMAIFQVGGDRWARWNEAMQRVLVPSQRRSDDCFDGSWDWQGTGFHGHHVGRVLSTAYNTLSLQAYYRYAQVRQ